MTLKKPLNYLHKHPILLLLLLTPGIPEYLTGSSKTSALVLNPLQFLLQLALNLGLYGSGVLLIREAAIRWRKGWATVLLLGAAYGILEEGVALSTLYNSAADPVGKLGFYGHFLGVNWVWTAGIVPVHMVFSIALPILLLGLALPETNGKSLITSKNQIAALFAFLSIDVLFLFSLTLFARKFWMGWPVFIGSFIAIALLIYSAKRVPKDLFHAKTQFPKISPFRMGVLGVLFFVSVFFAQQLAIGRIPAAVDVVLVVLIQALLLIYVLMVGGKQNNSKHLVAFAAGLVAPLAFIGFISQIYLPIVLIADVTFALFLSILWRRFPS